MAADPGRPAHYEIRVEGALDDHWTAWFDGLQVNSEGRETAISGLVPDQSALHGLLVRIRDLGLCLISVHRLGPQADADEAWQPGMTMHSINNPDAHTWRNPPCPKHAQ